MEGRIRRPGEMPECERTYYINGRKYLFTSVHQELGVWKGYSHLKKKWAELHGSFVIFEGEAIVAAVKGE